MQIFAPVYAPGTSLELVKGAGVEFSHANYDSAGGPEVQIEFVEQVERSGQPHTSLHQLTIADTQILNLRYENLFQTGSRNDENAEQIRRSRSAQRIILFD